MTNKSNGLLVKDALSKATTKGTLAGLKSMDVQTVISGMKAQIAQALPKHITAERIIQLATTYVSNNPAIAKCTATSIVGAIMQTSILGLEPVPALGQVYFVPYKDQVQFQLGYKGFIRLAQNSKEIKMIYAEVVREGDYFEYELGLNPKVKHTPNAHSTGEENITHAYAVVHYHSGGYNFVVLTRSAIESLRKRSPSQRNGISGAWSTDYESMAKAKAIKQLSKYMPMSIEVQNAAVADEAIINEKSLSNNQTGIDLNSLEYANFDDETIIESNDFIDSESEGANNE